MLFNKIKLYIAGVEFPFAEGIRINGSGLHASLIFHIPEGNRSAFAALPISRLKHEYVPVKVCISLPHIMKPDSYADYVTVFEGNASMILQYDRDSGKCAVQINAVPNSMYALSGIVYGDLSIGEAFSTVRSAQETTNSVNMMERDGSISMTASAPTPATNFNSILFRERLLTGSRERQQVKVPSDMYDFTVNNLLQAAVYKGRVEPAGVVDFQDVAPLNISVDRYIKAYMDSKLKDDEVTEGEVSEPVPDIVDLKSSYVGFYKIFLEDILTLTRAVPLGDKPDDPALMEGILNHYTQKGIWAMDAYFYGHVVRNIYMYNKDEDAQTRSRGLIRDNYAPGPVSLVLRNYFSARNLYNQASFRLSRLPVSPPATPPGSDFFTGIDEPGQMSVAEPEDIRVGEDPDPEVGTSVPCLPQIMGIYSAIGKYIWGATASYTVFPEQSEYKTRLHELLSEILETPGDKELKDKYGIGRRDADSMLESFYKLTDTIAQTTLRALEDFMMELILHLGAGTLFTFQDTDSDDAAKRYLFNPFTYKEWACSISDLERYINEGRMPRNQEDPRGNRVKALWERFYTILFNNVTRHFTAFISSIARIIENTGYSTLLPSYLEQANYRVSARAFNTLSEHREKVYADLRKRKVVETGGGRDFKLFDLIAASLVLDNTVMNRMVTFGRLREEMEGQVFPTMKLKEYASFQQIISNAATSADHSASVWQMLVNLYGIMHMQLRLPTNKVLCRQENKTSKITGEGDLRDIVSPESVSEVMLLPEIGNWAIPSCNVLYQDTFVTRSEQYSEKINQSKILIRYEHSIAANVPDRSSVPAAYFLYDIYRPDIGLRKLPEYLGGANYAYISNRSGEYDRQFKAGYYYKMERSRTADISAEVSLMSALLNNTQPEPEDDTDISDRFTTPENTLLPKDLLEVVEEYGERLGTVLRGVPDMSLSFTQVSDIEKVEGDPGKALMRMTGKEYSDLMFAEEDRDRERLLNEAATLFMVLGDALFRKYNVSVDSDLPDSVFNSEDFKNEFTANYWADDSVREFVSGYITRRKGLMKLDFYEALEEEGVFTNISSDPDLDNLGLGSRRVVTYAFSFEISPRQDAVDIMTRALGEIRETARKAALEAGVTKKESAERFFKSPNVAELFAEQSIVLQDGMLAIQSMPPDVEGEKSSESPIMKFTRNIEHYRTLDVKSVRQNNVPQRDRDKVYTYGPASRVVMRTREVPYDVFEAYGDRVHGFFANAVGRYAALAGIYLFSEVFIKLPAGPDRVEVMNALSEHPDLALEILHIGIEENTRGKMIVRLKSEDDFASNDPLYLRAYSIISALEMDEVFEIDLRSAKIPGTSDLLFPETLVMGNFGIEKITVGGIDIEEGVDKYAPSLFNDIVGKTGYAVYTGKVDMSGREKLSDFNYEIRLLMVQEGFIKLTVEQELKAHEKYLYSVASKTGEELPSFSSWDGIANGDYLNLGDDKAVFRGGTSGGGLSNRIRRALSTKYVPVLLWTNLGHTVKVCAFNLYEGGAPIPLESSQPSIRGARPDSLESDVLMHPDIKKYADKMNPFKEGGVAEIWGENPEDLDYLCFIAPIPLMILEGRLDILTSFTEAHDKSFWKNMSEEMHKPYSEDRSSWDIRGVVADTVTRMAWKERKEIDRAEFLVKELGVEFAQQESGEASYEDTGGTAHDMLCNALCNFSGAPSSALITVPGGMFMRLRSSGGKYRLHNGLDLAPSDEGFVELKAPCAGRVSYFLDGTGSDADHPYLGGYGLYAVFQPNVRYGPDSKSCPALLLGHLGIKKTVTAVSFLNKYAGKKPVEIRTDQFYKNISETQSERPEKVRELREYFGNLSSTVYGVRKGDVIGVIGRSGVGGLHTHITACDCDTSTDAWRHGVDDRSLGPLRQVILANSSSPRFSEKQLEEQNKKKMLMRGCRDPYAAVAVLIGLPAIDAPGSSVYPGGSPSTTAERASVRITEYLTQGIKGSVRATRRAPSDLIKSIAENRAYMEAIGAFTGVQIPPVILPYYDPYFMDAGFPFAVCYKDDIVLTRLMDHSVSANTHGAVSSSLTFSQGLSVRRMTHLYLTLMSDPEIRKSRRASYMHNCTVFPLHVIDYFNDSLLNGEYMSGEYRDMFGREGFVFDWRKAVQIDIGVDGERRWVDVYTVARRGIYANLPDSVKTSIMTSSARFRVKMEGYIPEFKSTGEESLMMGYRAWDPSRLFSETVSRDPGRFAFKDVTKSHTGFFDKSFPEKYEPEAHNALSIPLSDSSPATMPRTFYDWHSFMEYLKTLIR